MYYWFINHQGVTRESPGVALASCLGWRRRWWGRGCCRWWECLSSGLPESVNLAAYPELVHMGRTVTAYLSKAEHSPPLDIPPAGTLARSFSSIMYNLVLVDCCHPRRVQTLSWQRSACKFHHSAPAQTRYGKFTVDLLDRLVRMSFK